MDNDVSILIAVVLSYIKYSTRWFEKLCIKKHPYLKASRYKLGTPTPVRRDRERNRLTEDGNRSCHEKETYAFECMPFQTQEQKPGHCPMAGQLPRNSSHCSYPCTSALSLPQALHELQVATCSAWFCVVESACLKQPWTREGMNKSLGIC